MNGDMLGVTLQSDNDTAAQDLLDAQSRSANFAALAGRVGRSIHLLRSTGVGNAKHLSRVDFRLTFVEQPTLTTGVEVLSGSLDFTALPLCTVGVYQWIKDGRGLYIGCHVWVAVGLALDTLQNQNQQVGGSATGYVLQHHLTFEGLTIRDVSYDAIMEDG